MCHPRPVGNRVRRDSRPAGSTLIEVLAAVAVSGALMAVAGPSVLAGRDTARAGEAARHLASVIRLHRTLAVSSGVHVGLRFTQSRPEGVWTAYADGDRDGVRTDDVASGVDRALGPSDSLVSGFPGVTFGIIAGTRDIDDGRPLEEPAVRLGTGGWLSIGPSGASSSGTIYVRGRTRGQYAVRVLGSTGRVRVLVYDPRRARWREP